MSIRTSMPANENTRQYDFTITSLRYVPTENIVYSHIGFSLPVDVAEDCYGEYNMILTAPFTIEWSEGHNFSMPYPNELEAVQTYISENIDKWINELIDNKQIEIAPKNIAGQYIGVE